MEKKPNHTMRIDIEFEDPDEIDESLMESQDQRDEQAEAIMRADEWCEQEKPIVYVSKNKSGDPILRCFVKSLSELDLSNKPMDESEQLVHQVLRMWCERYGETALYGLFDILGLKHPEVDEMPHVASGLLPSGKRVLFMNIDHATCADIKTSINETNAYIEKESPLHAEVPVIIRFVESPVELQLRLKTLHGIDTSKAQSPSR